MGLIHFIFLVLAAFMNGLIIFDTSPSSASAPEIIRITLLLVSPVLVGTYFLQQNLRTQVTVLKIIRIVLVVLLTVYYYLLWSQGGLTSWEASEGARWGGIVFRFAPLLGYACLTFCVRGLGMRLKLLNQVDRLRD